MLSVAALLFAYAAYEYLSDPLRADQAWDFTGIYDPANFYLQPVLAAAPCLPWAICTVYVYVYYMYIICILYVAVVQLYTEEGSTFKFGLSVKPAAALPHAAGGTSAVHVMFFFSLGQSFHCQNPTELFLREESILRSTHEKLLIE